MQLLSVSPMVVGILCTNNVDASSDVAQSHLSICQQRSDETDINRLTAFVSANEFR